MCLSRQIVSALQTGWRNVFIGHPRALFLFCPSTVGSLGLSLFLLVFLLPSRSAFAADTIQQTNTLLLFDVQDIAAQPELLSRLRGIGFEIRFVLPPSAVMGVATPSVEKDLVSRGKEFHLYGLHHDEVKPDGSPVAKRNDVSLQVWNRYFTPRGRRQNVPDPKACRKIFEHGLGRDLIRIDTLPPPVHPDYHVGGSPPPWIGDRLRRPFDSRVYGR